MPARITSRKRSVLLPAVSSLVMNIWHCYQRHTTKQQTRLAVITADTRHHRSPRFSNTCTKLIVIQSGAPRRRTTTAAPFKFTTTHRSKHRLKFRPRLLLPPQLKRQPRRHQWCVLSQSVSLAELNLAFHQCGFKNAVVLLLGCPRIQHLRAKTILCTRAASRRFAKAAAYGAYGAYGLLDKQKCTSEITKLFMGYDGSLKLRKAYSHRASTSSITINMNSLV